MPKNTATYSPQNNAANPVKEMIDALGRNKQINKTVKLEPIKQVERVRDTAKREIDKNTDIKAFQTQLDTPIYGETAVMLKGERAAMSISNGFDTPENRAAFEEYKKLQNTRAQLNNNIESIKSEAYKKAVGDEVAAVDNSMLNDANAARAIETGKKRKEYTELEKLSRGEGVLANGAFDAVNRYGANLVGSYTAKEKMTTLTQQDLDKVAYLYGSDQEERAKLYVADILDRELNRRASEKRTKETYEAFGGDNATDAQELGAGVSSVITSPQKSFGAAVGIGQSIKNAITGGYEDIDTSSAMYQGTKGNNAMRELAVKDLDDGQKFWANTIMSMGDMMVALPFGSWIAPAIMAGGVMSDSTLQAAEDGASAEQATLLGVVNGIATYATEKIGFDKIFATHAMAKNLGKSGFKQFVKAAAQNAAVEGMEESSEEIINIVADMAIMGDKGEIKA
ncbi:MAG: hypothetical protein RR449_08105, partial [Christensenella sp.]